MISRTSAPLVSCVGGLERNGIFHQLLVEQVQQSMPRAASVTRSEASASGRDVSGSIQAGNSVKLLRAPLCRLHLSAGETVTGTWEYTSCASQAEVVLGE
jgi:hypothetical protein